MPFKIDTIYAPQSVSAQASAMLRGNIKTEHKVRDYTRMQCQLGEPASLQNKGDLQPNLGKGGWQHKPKNTSVQSGPSHGLKEDPE